MQKFPPIPGSPVSPMRLFVGFPAPAAPRLAGQARTVFYQYAPPKQKNPEAVVGWLLVGIAFLAAGFPVFGIGMYFIGIFLCIAGFVIGSVVASRGALHIGLALILMSIAAVPGGIFLAPWFSALFA